MYYSVQASADNVLFNELAPSEVAKVLGWTTSPETKDLCNGCYPRQPQIVLAYPNPPSDNKIATTIVAKSVSYATQGDSMMEDITITQPGHQIVADRMILHRDPKTYKIVSADLFGHVKLYEYGKFIIGNYGHEDFITKTVTIDNAVYHLELPKPQFGTTNIWGKMKQGIRDQTGVLTLFNSSFNTCQPNSNTWYLDSKKMILNKNTGLGEAYNAIFRIKDLPSLYLPYFQFPIDDRRRSGFLYPELAYSDDNGLDLALPYYFNLAPNYDFTLTPRVMTSRGLLLGGLFRYLTATSEGEINAEYINNDNGFKNFQHDAITEYAGGRALSRLENSSANRGAISLQNNTTFNDHWNGKLEINYVTDDYFYSDFGTLPSDITEDQLLNEAKIQYADDHWQFLARVQAFQTLHMVDETTEDQYSRLPQLDLIGYFPEQALGLNYKLNTEFVYFDHTRTDFYNSKELIPIGDRFNIQPSIDLPLNSGGTYVNPKLQIPITFYELSNLPTSNIPGNAPATNISRIIPIFDIDSGLMFERDTHLLGKNYVQTIEPRVFYLYAPYKNQDDIPAFDTSFSTFTFDNLFRTNRFSSIDRIGDANQFSVAVTSRLLDGQTGQEKVKASIGQIYALNTHQVCLDSNGNNNCASDPLATEKISPMYGELKYYLNHNWSITGDIGWDFNKDDKSNQKGLNTADLNIQYLDKYSHVVNLGYNFLVNGDSNDGQTVDLNRINASVAFPINMRWSAYGEVDYYLSSQQTQTYIVGLQYNSCCWSFRLAQSRVYKGYDQYDNRIYLQFLLKGLGSIGTSNVGSLLTSNISGFKDDYK